MARRRILHDLTLDKIAAVDMPCQEGAVSTIFKRSYTEDERKALADKGQALPDGSFPIVTAADLGNAIQSYGRAGNKPKVKAHIIARAKALGAVDQLPEDWSVTKIAKAIDELRKVDMPAARGFSEILAENEAREQCWAAESAMWPLFDALRSSLSSIAADPSLDDATKISRVEGSVSEFVGALKTEWPDVAEEVDEISKASPNADRMAAFIKAGLSGRPLSKENPMSDVKTVAELTKSVEDITKERDEALAKVAELEKAKTSGCVDEMEMDGTPTKKGLEFIAKHASKGGDESLSVNGTTISKAAVGEATFSMLKAQQAEITKERDARIDAEMTKRAGDEFPSLVGTNVEKAKVLRHMQTAPEDVRKTFDTILAAAEKATKGAFETAGSSGPGSPAAGGGTIAKARQDFMAKVSEIQSRDKISKTDAMSKAQAENPDLYKVMQGEGAE